MHAVTAMKNAQSPAKYVAALSGWQKKHVTLLRRAVRAPGLEETIKWGNLVYQANGPVCVIRAEGARVLLGFWRGQRLQHIEPRLKAGGKYEMATLALDADGSIAPRVVRELVAAAIALNHTVGDPTDLTTYAGARKGGKRGK
jgi:hypothetical protein